MLEQKIKQLVDARMEDSASFETFSAELLRPGVDRLHYDVLKDEMSFFSV